MALRNPLPIPHTQTQAKLASMFQTSMVPWGAVAAEVTEAGPPEPGRGFCFLPLPGPNGLPVHVNGFFELSTNRCVVCGPPGGGGGE